MLCACIDIGSNTTRLLVAEVAGGSIEEVLSRRAFTRLGKELRATGAVSPAKVAEIGEIVAGQRALAESIGAQAIATVATAAIRTASNRRQLVHAIRERAGVVVNVLDGEEEARLAFVGATQTLQLPPAGEVGVVDVGGGSTEIAVGTLAAGVTWSVSVGIGSGFLADAYLAADPPAASELHAIREHAAGCFEGLDVPRPERAVAVGGSATSVRQLVGPVLDAGSIGLALRTLSASPVEQVAVSLGLDAERVRLLPAGLLVLAECSSVLGRPLEIGRGGIREGVCLELGAVAES